MEQDVKKKVGNHIRELRKGKGLTIEEAAFNAHIPASHLGQIERGEKNVTVETLWKIALSLQRPMAELMEIGEEWEEEEPGDELSLLRTLEEEFRKVKPKKQVKVVRIFTEIVRLALEGEGEE